MLDMSNTLDTTNDTISTMTENIDELLAVARPRLLRLAHAHGVLHDAADDVVQETLLEAWRHLDALREQNRFDAWLNGICRNVCLRWSRTQSIAATRQVSLSHLYPETHDEDSSELPLPDPSMFDPAEELSRQDMGVLLDRALGYLPKGTREAVELHYLSELPQREAALQLGMTIHALEERLHRARRQLRQLLNNELRSEAETFGLALCQEESTGWRETREWCHFCGHRHLRGVLESRTDGLGSLRMHCPSCSPIYGEIHTSSWAPQFYGLRSFGPALKRLNAMMKPYMTQSLIDGGYPCRSCATEARLRITSPGEPHGTFSHPHPHHALVLECPACAEFSSMWAGGATLWFHPAPRDFIQQHPQWFIGPEMTVEYASQPAIRFCMIDPSSDARLIVIAHYQTLQVLATFQE